GTARRRAAARRDEEQVLAGQGCRAEVGGRRVDDRTQILGCRPGAVDRWPRRLPDVVRVRRATDIPLTEAAGDVQLQAAWRLDRAALWKRRVHDGSLGVSRPPG